MYVSRFPNSPALAAPSPDSGGQSRRSNESGASAAARSILAEHMGSLLCVLEAQDRVFALGRPDALSFIDVVTEATGCLRALLVLVSCSWLGQIQCNGVEDSLTSRSSIPGVGEGSFSFRGEGLGPILRRRRHGGCRLHLAWPSATGGSPAVGPWRRWLSASREASYRAV